MGIIKVSETEKVEKLFHNWHETFIGTCLQKVMGSIYADDYDKPESAMANVGDISFYAGKPNRELVLYKPVECKKDYIIMVPQTEEWGEIITNSYGDKAKKFTRYAFKKQKDVFDVAKLEKAVSSLDSQYSIKMIDEDIYNYCKANDWCRDLVSLFTDYEMYKSLGLGVVITKDNIPVSGASSYFRYREGIEIEIDTKEEYRRKGLAYICGAKLILECLKRDLYPSWDAHNEWSLALAKKLGYQYDYDYTAYEITGY